MKWNHKIAYVSWGIALLAMFTSLIFSEVMRLPPCSLCWYQRIFMYPLVFIIPLGIIKNDKNILGYSLVLGLIGLIISAYHVLLYYGIIPETLKLCNADLSCKARQFELFGFISIPIMSFCSFLFISVLNIVGVKNVKRN